MPHADIMGDRIFVQTAWNERDLVKLIPGARYHTEHKMWHLPLTWPACLQLRGVFGEKLTYGDQLANWAYAERIRADTSLRLRGLTHPEAGPLPGDRLREFQRAGVDYLRVAGSALLADDMGLGKTVQILALLDELRRTGDGLPALVVCPKSVKLNWAREAAAWLPRANSYVIGGGAAGRRSALLDASEDPDALVMVSFDALRSHSRLAPYGSIRLRRCRECGNVETQVQPSMCEVHPQELNWMPFKTVIIDEAHRIKDPSAKQTRAAWAVGHSDSVRRRFALTGTPIGNAPDDLWSIMHFLAPDEHPVKSTYVDRYCLTSWGVYGGVEISTA